MLHFVDISLVAWLESPGAFSHISLERLLLCLHPTVVGRYVALTFKLYHSLSSTRSMMMSRHLCWIGLLHRLTLIWSLHTCWMLYLVRNLRSHHACMHAICSCSSWCHLGNWFVTTFLGNFTGKGTFCFTRWLRVTDNFWGIRKCGVGSGKLTQYGLYIMSLNWFWWECKLTSDNDVTRYQSWKVG